MRFHFCARGSPDRSGDGEAAAIAMLEAMTSSWIPDFVRCPACFASMGDAAGDRLECSASDCGALYPVYAGVPWLFRDVDGSRSQWADKLSLFRQEIAEERAGYETAQEAAVDLDSVRTRLARQAEGLGRLEAQVLELLSPFELAAANRPEGLPSDRIPSAQHVTSCLETAFRDWCWGEAEIDETRRLMVHWSRREKLPLAEHLY